MDIVLRAGADATIPELGFGGYAPSAEIIYLTIDPANPALSGNLEEPLQRIIAHEFHHIHRWRGPGYGTTLGEALVSEGLAGRFVSSLFGSAPEPWEQILPGPQLSDYARLARSAWSASKYDHAQWFFGRGRLPRWVGYTLGYAIVGHFLQQTGTTAADQVHEPADSYLNSLESIGLGVDS